MNKELIFSLSKDNGDFIVQPFKGSGNGGQKRNKTMSACRIIHKDSNTISECQEERSFEQNKKKAFKRLLEKESFVVWFKLEKLKRLGYLADIENQVQKDMADKNLKVEIKINGRWVELDIND